MAGCAPYIGAREEQAMKTSATTVYYKYIMYVRTIHCTVHYTVLYTAEFGRLIGYFWCCLSTKDENKELVYIF